MRLNLLVNFLAFDNNQNTNDPADAIKIKKELQLQGVTEVTRHFPRKITNGTTDESVTLPDANTDMALILTDQEISIKMNGNSSETLKPRAAGVKTFAYYKKGDITSLSISNSSGEDANVDIILVQE